MNIILIILSLFVSDVSGETQFTSLDEIEYVSSETSEIVWENGFSQKAVLTQNPSFKPKLKFLFKIFLKVVKAPSTIPVYILRPG